GELGPGGPLWQGHARSERGEPGQDVGLGALRVVAPPPAAVLVGGGIDGKRHRGRRERSLLQDGVGPDDRRGPGRQARNGRELLRRRGHVHPPVRPEVLVDRKSTRLNSSHEWISYA